MILTVDASQMFSFMDIILLACGGYMLYVWYLLQFRDEVKEGVLLPKDSRKTCSDFAAYKRFMSPRLLVFSILVVAGGAAGLYSDYVSELNGTLVLVGTGVFLVAVIWFAYCIKKSEKLYFR